MRLAKIKDENNLGVFKEIISLQIVDGQVEACVIHHNGQQLRITATHSYSPVLSLLVDEAKEETTLYRVKGTYMGMDIVPKVFESDYDAKNFIIEMNSKLSYDESHTLEVEEFVELRDKTKIS